VVIAAKRVNDGVDLTSHFEVLPANAVRDTTEGIATLSAPAPGIAKPNAVNVKTGYQVFPCGLTDEVDSRCDCLSLEKRHLARAGGVSPAETTGVDAFLPVGR